MNTITSTSKITFTKTNAGVLRIGRTRVSLDSVIITFNFGATPEKIVQDYDTLTLTEVCAAISYYLQNHEEVDEYLEKREKQNAELRQINDARFSHRGIREKLLARQRVKNYS